MIAFYSFGRHFQSLMHYLLTKVSLIGKLLSIESLSLLKKFYHRLKAVYKSFESVHLCSSILYNKIAFG